MGAHTKSYGAEFSASGVSGSLDSAFLANYANMSTNNRGANVNDDGMESSIVFNGLGVGAFNAKGRDLGRHTFNAGAGMKFSKDRYDFGVRYDYYGKADYDAHRVVATFGVSF